MPRCSAFVRIAKSTTTSPPRKTTRCRLPAATAESDRDTWAGVGCPASISSSSILARIAMYLLVSFVCVSKALARRKLGEGQGNLRDRLCRASAQSASAAAQDRLVDRLASCLPYFSASGTSRRGIGFWSAPQPAQNRATQSRMCFLDARSGNSRDSRPTSRSRRGPWRGRHSRRRRPPACR